MLVEYRVVKMFSRNCVGPTLNTTDQSWKVFDVVCLPHKNITENGQPVKIWLSTKEMTSCL